MYANVLVEYTNKVVDKEFTYIIPDDLKDKVRVGSRVKVEFASKIINGIVVKIVNVYKGEYELKSIRDKLEVS